MENEFCYDYFADLLLGVSVAFAPKFDSEV